MGYLIIFLLGIFVGAAITVFVKVVLWHLAISVFILMIIAMVFSLLKSGAIADEQSAILLNKLRRQGKPDEYEF